MFVERRKRMPPLLRSEEHDSEEEWKTNLKDIHGSGSSGV